MGGVTLLNQARAAGLRLSWDGELLRIKGARKHTALAKELLDRKAEVIEALVAEADNIEMHDSALFDVVVEIDFYDGRRLRIPQTSTPPGWSSPF